MDQDKLAQIPMHKWALREATLTLFVLMRRALTQMAQRGSEAAAN